MTEEKLKRIAELNKEIEDSKKWGTLYLNDIEKYKAEGNEVFVIATERELAREGVRLLRLMSELHELEAMVE